MARRQKKLRPAGHSAVIETLIQPAIVIASTLMSAIAAYVLAYDEISRLLANTGDWQDGFVVVLCVGMGFLIDMAIIVSATRYKMHAVRADPREARWLSLAKWVLIIGLTSETMTLFYFFVRLDPTAYPGWLVWTAGLVHAFLVSARAFLPPVVVAYFAAGVLPVAFDRADRNREIKTRTSSNIMVLIDRLSVVQDTEDKGEMLRALGGQLVLDTYATYDETARTSEDEQLKRDGKLLAHMARMHGLDWSTLGADVAPELTNGIERSQHVTQPRSLSRHDAKRARLEADMYGSAYGVRAHPTSPRLDDLDEDDGPDWGASGSFDDADPWQDEDARMLRAGRLDMSNHTGRRDRAQAARIAPRGAEMTVREAFVMPDLPASRYEREDDSDQCRAVLRVLDADSSLTNAQVSEQAHVALNTVKVYRPLWNDRRKNGSKRQRKAAPVTAEFPAVTSDMIATSR